MKNSRRSIVITDLTRFKKDDATLCTAGIDLETGECFRPFPHLQKTFCRDHVILPGVVISACLSLIKVRTLPHSEDAFCKELKVERTLNSESFLEVLEGDAVSSIEEGFGMPLPHGEKHFPKESPPSISLMTLRVHPAQIHLHQGIGPGTLRMHLGGHGARSIHDLPVADLRFHSLVQQHPESEFYVDLNRELHSKDEVFLRLGLGRCYTNQQGKEGHWLQVNGIYTFPEKLGTLPVDPW
jgi:hypothetical protein